MRFDLNDAHITARDVEELGNALGDLHRRLKAIMDATPPEEAKADGKSAQQPIMVRHLWDVELDGRREPRGGGGGGKT